MASLTLSEAAIRAGATEKSLARGRELFRRGAVSRAAIQGHALSGVCEGSEAPFYRVRAELDEGGVRSASCTCPYDFGGYCKHIIALLLSYAHNSESFAARKEPTELLSELSREQLLVLLTRLLGELPDLYELIEAALAAPSVSGGGKTAPSKPREVDVEVYRRRVNSIMHGLDHMRASEAYWHVGGLTDELRGVERSAREFLDAGEAEAALRILLTLVEESSDGFEYVDDSNGELGDFLNGLGATLAEVILSLDLDEDEREDLLSDLDDLHGQLSDYGIEGLGIALLAARHGWEELPASARPGETRSRYEDEDDEDAEADEDEWYASGWAPEDPVQVLTRAKLNVLERQGRTDEYLTLCLRADEHLRYTLKLLSLGRTPEAVSHALKRLANAGEALTLAQRLRDSGHLDEAIRVGERGLWLKGHKADLGRWLGAIEETQGRTKQALAAWRAAFRETPSLDLWRTLKRLAGRGWSKLKPKAMSSLEQFYDKRPLAEVLVEEQEWDTAIRLADGHAQEHEVAATVADALITRRPEWVIRASVKHAEALIAPTKSSLYPAAADWLRRARAAYAHSGQADEWQQYLQRLKEQYKRRPALMAQLKSL
ncbi:MAG TPA: SWIM zinc finger family protein [Pyrinomonadaceae bacterium]